VNDALRNRVGSTYALAGFYNPSGMFPARVVPIFEPVRKPSNHVPQLLQVIGDGGSIIDFEEAQSIENVVIWRKAFFSGVGQPAVHALALSPDNIVIGLGETDFSSRCQDVLEAAYEKDILSHPIFFVELARFARRPDFEVRSAVMAVKSIAELSPRIANTWLQRAPLSTEARNEARIAFGKFLMDLNSSAEPMLAFATISLSDSASIQGLLVHDFLGGEVMIDVFGEFYVGKRARYFESSEK
jgi:hypothetical protein